MAGEKTTAAVAVSGLCRSFVEGQPVLDQLDFEVKGGEFFGIIGPNGSGKTTLLRLLTGFLKPDGGTVSIQGQPLESLDQRQLARKVAFVPQESQVVFPFTVMEVVLQGRYPYLGRLGFEDRKDLEVARWAMEITETFSMRRRWIGDLSGGERQRVIIARALAQEPEIILLDEPTSFLDIRHQVQIHELLRRLNRERGLTVISVLHDLTTASTYFDRLCLLHRSRAVRIGPPEEVIEYQLIKEVYGTEVYIDINTVTGRPYIIPLPPAKDGEADRRAES